MSVYSRLREQPDTARAGLKWTEEENEQLMKEVIDGIDLNEIAKKHQRTLSGIKQRIMNNALTMAETQEITLQDVSELLHIPMVDLENHKKKQERKATALHQKKNQTKIESSSSVLIEKETSQHQEIMSILTEIRDYLKIISEKQMM